MFSQLRCSSKECSASKDIPVQKYSVRKDIPVQKNAVCRDLSFQNIQSVKYASAKHSVG
jgi:hypothetical protein